MQIINFKKFGNKKPNLMLGFLKPFDMLCGLQFHYTLTCWLYKYKYYLN